MPRDTRTYLMDAIDAASKVLRFVTDTSFTEYEADDLLRSGVERQMEIVGEALNQMSRQDPGTAARIPDLGIVVGFRNILVHGYAKVDDRRGWRTVQEELPDFRAQLQALVDELDG